MTEEEAVLEKNTVLELKSFKEDSECKYWIGDNGVKAVDTVIEILKRKDNEIEELKEKIKLCESTGIKLVNKKIFADTFIHKQKIKDRIEELTELLFVGNADDFYNRRRKYAIEILQELLNEEE